MIKFNKFILLFFLISLVALTQEKIGLVGVKFLDIGVGAKPIGMSSAYVAVTSGSDAVFWNPAGIATSTGTSIFADKTVWWAGTSLNSVSFTQAIGFMGNIGFFYSGFFSGEWDATTDQEIYGTGIYVSYNAYEAGISFGRYLTDRFAFGFNIKMLREDYPEEDWTNKHSASTFVLDIGGLYEIPIRDLTIGLSIMNYSADVTPIGTYTEYEDGRVVSDTTGFRFYHIPMRYTLGISMTLFEADMLKALGAIDLVHPSDNNERINAGIDLKLLEVLSLRTGYTIGRDENINAWSFGIGVSQIGGIVRGLGVDYSYTYGHILPATHRFSLSLGL